MPREHGFSLIEMTMATGLMLVVTASVFSLMNPAQGSFSTQHEVADMQQRLRVASDSLFKDLVMAGGGAYQGPMSGPLVYFFAPVMPFRNGSADDDPPGTFRTNTITVTYVRSTVSQTELVDRGPSSNAAEIDVAAQAGCPTADPSCGFEPGMTVLLYDDAGHFDTFTITDVPAAGRLLLRHNSDELTYTGYDKANTRVVRAAHIVYDLKSDDARGTYQLMVNSGGLNPDVPVVDHVVGLHFDYYGDPQPPLVTKALSDATGPWTSYGPPPKRVEVAPFGAGENCLFMNDGSPTPAPRLATLGGSSGLVKLTQAQLTDGPWCPNDGSNNRFDADLFRIRKVAVTVRVQSAVAALRGPAGALFSHSGTSRGGSQWAPDHEVRFQVTPRNLNLGR